MKLTIITGHYGCGKTNLSINLAIKRKVRNIVDLDVVNPYFRTSDYSELLEKNGIKVHGPNFANTNLDTPSLSASIGNAISEGNAVIDVGGDDAGATALGRYADSVKDYEMYYVVNRFRSLTTKPEEACEILTEIEKTCRLKATGIVNNSHLKSETTAQTVLDSLEFAEKVSELTGLPVVYNTCPKHLEKELSSVKNLFPVDIYVNAPWEHTQ